MKKIFALAAFLICACVSFAQNTYPDQGTYSTYSQLWNTSSAYYFTPTFKTKTVTNLGTQKDTLVNTGSLSLYSSYFNSTIDSFIVSPLEGWGGVTLTYAVYKCTGTPTTNVTPVSSSDGIIWAQIPGTTIATITPTSLTVPVVGKFLFTQKPDKYVGLLFSGSSSSTVMCQGWDYLIRPYVFGN